MTLAKSDFVFFWSTKGLNSWACQWKPSPFRAAVKLMPGGEAEEVEFPTCEHWMMLQKALLFDDENVAREVMESDDMKTVKALGRKVKAFNEDIWNANRGKIVREGNLHKFRQNGDMRRMLLATGEKVLVEASPFDKIWGIGLKEENVAVNDQSNWGLNLLGKALMEVRKILREEERIEKSAG